MMAHPLFTLGNLALLVLCSGLIFAWGFGCLPLLVSSWRESPHGRFGLLSPFVLRLGLGISFLVLIAVQPLLVLLTLVYPFITALLLMRVSREARALREMTPAHTRLSFALVSGMGITLLGGLFWNLSAVLGSLPFVWQFAPFLPALGAAVFVAICTLFKSRKSKQPRPKDASPADVDSEHSPRGYRG